VSPQSTTTGRWNSANEFAEKLKFLPCLTGHYCAAARPYP
jgi:hypothetical protein